MEPSIKNLRATLATFMSVHSRCGGTRQKRFRLRATYHKLYCSDAVFMRTRAGRRTYNSEDTLHADRMALPLAA